MDEQQQKFEALVQEVNGQSRNQPKGGGLDPSKQFIIGSVTISIALIVSAIILTK